GRTRGEIEQARAELGLESELQLLGALPQSEVIGCWRQADVGVLCSHSEGMPVSLMEAAACGVPVVATDVGGISELVEQGKTGFVVPPGDVNAMADALERVLTSRASIAGDPCETRVTSRASIAGDPCETRVTSRASIAGDPCETRTSRELATEMSWNARLRALSVLSIQHQVDSLTSVWEASIAGERQMA
ncbi:MAG: glycosyltransferase family 4 protein, partial [Rhodocyclaceae bacterium]|nr:glycosyltransferase family 4 protein [Rhodocyclaceae bacterium]